MLNLWAQISFPLIIVVILQSQFGFMKKVKVLYFLVCSFLLFVACAKRGSITGGDKDNKPPKMLTASPKNLSTSFDKKTIKITFDEYIKIKDLQKNLIVSPPMKTPITVLPQGTASKNLVIKINDSLKANTTYSFNFGQSIVDNNEENVLRQFKYVFSTGKDLDSLSIEGILKDSYEKEAPKFVNVMLFEMTEKSTDSIIYKEQPRYITTTSDSTSTFKIENIKAGKYKLIALKERSINYKFDPKSDKIAFYNQIVTVPDKSIFELELFKEVAPFKLKKPAQVSGNRIVLGYEGNRKNLKITTHKNGIEIPSRINKIIDKDSLQIWVNPMKNDSLEVRVTEENKTTPFVVKMRNQRKDTLKITAKTSILGLQEDYKISSTVPLEKWDVSKMRLIKKDSSKVDFKVAYDAEKQEIALLFPKEFDQKYTFKAQKNAFEDYLGQKNDSLKFTFSTRNPEDYGNLKIVFKNPKSFPFLVELTNNKGKILASQYVDKKPEVEFTLLEPEKYSLRVVYDTNSNGQRDTGSYLENKQPEEVYHFPKEIDVRANWDVNQEVDLK